MEIVQVLIISIILWMNDEVTQIIQWCLWDHSSTVIAGALACLKMHIAVLQQTGQVAEITD